MLTASQLDLIQPKRQDGNTDATDTTGKNGFFSAAGGKGRAEGESKSVLIRGIRGIRFAILSLSAKRGEASNSAKRIIVVIVVYIVVKSTISSEAAKTVTITPYNSLVRGGVLNCYKQTKT